VKRNALGRKIFEVVGEDKALDTTDLMHITDLLEPGALRGMSRVTRLSDALGVATALQQYAARFFGQGASMSGVIEYPGALTAQQAKDLSDAFDSRHRGLSRAHRTGVISGGAKFSSTQVTNDAAQFLESRRFAVEEIARLYNIPLSMMGVPGTQSYASVEQNAIQFVTHTLRPYIEKLEWSYSRLLPDTAFLKFNVDGLLRGDFNSRISAYSVAIQGGWESINDIRRLEDQSPVEGGDVYRVPLANVNLSAADIPEMEGKVKMAQQLVTVGFDPAAVLAALGLPNISHTGVPSVQLQSVAQIDPTNPGSVY
jgi:HK97 family phage portal protein